MEQLTLFEEFENIENLHEDNTIYFAPLNWRAKFKFIDNGGNEVEAAYKLMYAASFVF